MMQLSLNNKLSIFLAITVIAIIGSPFVYAAVEPHIILVMDSSQTTNPFTIQNNTGYDVMTIKPDGSVNGLISTAYSSDTTPVSIVAGNDITDPVIIASWEFDRTLTDTEDATNIPANDHYLSAHIKRDTGAGVCYVAWMYNTGASWSYVLRASQTLTTYDSKTGTSGAFYIPNTADNWALGLYNSDGATTCSYKNIASMGVIVLGTDLTFYRGV